MFPQNAHRLCGGLLPGMVLGNFFSYAGPPDTDHHIHIHLLLFNSHITAFYRVWYPRKHCFEPLSVLTDVRKTVFGKNSLYLDCFSSQSRSQKKCAGHQMPDARCNPGPKAGITRRFPAGRHTGNSTCRWHTARPEGSRPGKPDRWSGAYRLSAG